MTTAVSFLSSMLLASALVVAAACGSEGATAADPGRVEIRVDGSGYHPSRVAASAGQPITLVFTRTSDDGCGEELVIASHDIRRELPLNRPVEIALTPARAGDITFACGMDMYRGTIAVQ